LVVNGNTTTINSNTISTNDLVINMANNAATAAAANGGGIGVGPVGTEYASLLYNNTTNSWNIPTGNTGAVGLSVVGNVTSANLLTGGLISATGNITGSNIQAANLRTTGLISATGNIDVGNVRHCRYSSVPQVLMPPHGNYTYRRGMHKFNRKCHVAVNILNCRPDFSATGNIDAGNVTNSRADQCHWQH
jgi:hypothetical protein